MSKIDSFYNDMMEIQKALESTSKELKNAVNVYETEEKEKLKKYILENVIKPKLEELVMTNTIDIETSKEFQFNDNWLLKKYRTATGNLNKACKDAIQAEIQRLIDSYNQKQKDIQTIKSTVGALVLAHQLDEGTLSYEKYVRFYLNGYPIVDIQKMINSDLEDIKRNIERAREKARQEEAEKVRKIIKEAEQENVNKRDLKGFEQEGINYTDETQTPLKTVEKQALSVDIVDTPAQYEGRTYNYMYQFEGSYGAIKTFSNFLKILAQATDFKYTRK